MTTFDLNELLSALPLNLITFNGISILFSNALTLVCYVLGSLGLYTLATRRGIYHAWMAWVPVLRVYLLGCVSDQYRYVVKGENKAKRKALLILSILVFLLTAGIFIAGVSLVVKLFMCFSSRMSERLLMQSVLGLVLGIGIAALVLAGLSIACAVVRFIALYDLYRSCDPDNSVLFLLLSIFVPVTQAFFVFFIRNRDTGMPPRLDARPPEPQPSADPWQ